MTSNRRRLRCRTFVSLEGNGRRALSLKRRIEALQVTMPRRVRTKFRALTIVTPFGYTRVTRGQCHDGIKKLTRGPPVIDETIEKIDYPGR